MTVDNSPTPPPDALAAINAGTTQVLRKVEIYESDGTSLWMPGDGSRLRDGSVSVDYSRDERRTLDSMVLDNQDGLLTANPLGGLWYDKVIKTFRGVRYPVISRTPSVVIISSASNSSGYALRGVLSQLGITTVDVKLGAITTDEVEGYDVILVDASDSPVPNPAFVQHLYDAGRNIFTIGNNLTAAQVPFINTVATAGAPDWGISPTTADSPLRGTFTDETYPAAAGTWVLNVVAGAIPVARWNPAGGSTYYVTAAVKENDNDGRWFHFHSDDWGTQARSLWKAALDWLYKFEPYKDWQTQIGEFCIDKIDSPSFPHTVTISGRDYTKRCLTSKMEKSVSFAAGTSLRELIVALAANAGITKMNIPTITEKLNSRVDIERGTERWNVMKQASNSLGYEIYFDRFGYLTLRKYLDPTTSPESMTFQTGPKVGNIVDLSKSVNDSRLYNHIIVTGENESQDGAAITLPFFGEAKNENPSSPTNIARLGDRAYFFTSTFFTSDQQCQDLADAWIKIHALESFEMSLQTLNYIWLDVGEIIRILDPNRIETDPTRYLMDTMSISLGLDPLSATGKRVTYAGQAAGPSNSEQTEADSEEAA
jgi:hypothetical protein